MNDDYYISSTEGFDPEEMEIYEHGTEDQQELLSMKLNPSTYGYYGESIPDDTLTLVSNALLDSISYKTLYLEYVDHAKQRSMNLTDFVIAMETARFSGTYDSDSNIPSELFEDVLESPMGISTRAFFEEVVTTGIIGDYSSDYVIPTSDRRTYLEAVERENEWNRLEALGTPREEIIVHLETYEPNIELDVLGNESTGIELIAKQLQILENVSMYEFIFEMANWQPRDSGLPLGIWFDEIGAAGNNKRHSPRVKVIMPNDDLIPVSISENPTILLKGAQLVKAKKEFSSSDQTEMFDYIGKHHGVMLSHWNGEITTAMLFEKLKEG